MQNHENMNDGVFTNSPKVMNSSFNMQAMNQPPYYQSGVSPMMAGTMAYQMVYPEIFYKVQPYIMMVCDQMDTYSSLMPTQEMVAQMTDGIYDDVCRMYPDLAEYARSNDKKAKDDPPDPVGFGREPGMFGRDQEGFGRGFRRRGMFRDLLDILLLSEFSRRRRRFF